MALTAKQKRLYDEVDRAQKQEALYSEIYEIDKKITRLESEIMKLRDRRIALYDKLYQIRRENYG